MNSTAAANLMWPSPEYPESCAIAKVSIGRSLLPPEEIRWLATSGIIVTSEPVRDRIVALTRSMSGATSALRRSIDAEGWFSKGTTTATGFSTRQAPHHRKASGCSQARAEVGQLR